MNEEDTVPWGLVFDVDGVIANTEPIAMEATETVFREFHGVTVAREDMLQLMGSTAPAYFSALAGIYAPGADIAELIAGHDRLLMRKLRRTQNLIFSGVRSLFVRASNDETCRIGLATGSGRARSEATIAACSVPTESVKAWITGDDIVCAKPNPEIYLKAAETLGLDTSRCVAIEDSIAGVRSAKSAGMICIAVSNTFPAAVLSEADEVVSSLDDVTPQELKSFL